LLFYFQIIDTPGLFDTEDAERWRESIRTAALMDDKLDAVLYVINVFSRYTWEEYTAFKAVKELFGAGHAITNYVFIVFTHGDGLKKEKKSIEDLIKEAGEDFQEVLRECGFRYVLFNNASKKDRKKKDMRLELLKKVRGNLDRNSGKSFVCPMQQEVCQYIENKARRSDQVQKIKKQTADTQKQKDEVLAKLAELSSAQKETNDSQSKRLRDLEQQIKTLHDKMEKLQTEEKEAVETEKSVVKRQIAERNEDIMKEMKEIAPKAHKRHVKVAPMQSESSEEGKLSEAKSPTKFNPHTPL
jgi:DNA repair exonuclease SbcCD ATPase subunit